MKTTVTILSLVSSLLSASVAFAQFGFGFSPPKTESNAAEVVKKLERNEVTLETAQEISTHVAAQMAREGVAEKDIKEAFALAAQIVTSESSQYSTSQKVSEKIKILAIAQLAPALLSPKAKNENAQIQAISMASELVKIPAISSSHNKIVSFAHILAGIIETPTIQEIGQKEIISRDYLLESFYSGSRMLLKEGVGSAEATGELGAVLLRLRLKRNMNVDQQKALVKKAFEIIAVSGSTSLRAVAAADVVLALGEYASKRNLSIESLDIETARKAYQKVKMEQAISSSRLFATRLDQELGSKAPTCNQIFTY